MEVHHHPHVEKKNFKEYFLEFLMIFLAVTLGFVAENIREGVSDNAKGKEYVSALIQNLKDDTTGMNNTIEENERKLSKLKKLISFSHQDLSPAQVRQDLYRICGSSVTYYSLFKNNDATIQQLKNSGGLRFIRKQHAADSIAHYDVELTGLYGAAALYTHANDLGIAASQEMVDYSIYYDSSYFKDGEFTSKPLPLLTSDPVKQKFFFNAVTFEIGATINYLNSLYTRKPYAIRLLKFLKKEYQLENE